MKLWDRIALIIFNVWKWGVYLFGSYFLVAFLFQNQEAMTKFLTGGSDYLLVGTGVIIATIFGFILGLHGIILIILFLLLIFSIYRRAIRIRRY